MTPQCSGRGPTITIGMIWLTVLLWLSFTVFCDADPGGTVKNIYNILGDVKPLSPGVFETGNYPGGSSGPTAIFWLLGAFLCPLVSGLRG